MAKAKEYMALFLIFLSGFVIRVIYFAVAGYSTDYYRHLGLIRNLLSGKGFTLFGGQTYISYPDLWYRFLTFLSRAENPILFISALSAASIILIYFIAKHYYDRETAFYAAIIWAFCAQVIVNFSTYGSEAFGMLVFLSSFFILLKSKERALAFIFSALLFGLACTVRIYYILLIPLYIFRMRKKSYLLVFSAIFGIYVFMKNYAVINSSPYIFQDSGFCTLSNTYTALTTLFPLRHPDMVSFLQKDLDLISHYYRSAGVWTQSFILLCIGAVILSERLEFIYWSLGSLIIIFLLAPVLLIIRHSMFIFVPMIVSLAYMIRQMRRPIAVFMIIFSIVIGAKNLIPSKMPEPTQVKVRLQGKIDQSIIKRTEQIVGIPGKDILVNGGWEIPESLQYLYPEKNFYGLCARKEDLEGLISYYSVEYLLLHEDKMFSPQKETVEFIKSNPKFKLVKSFELDEEKTIHGIKRFWLYKKVK